MKSCKFSLSMFLTISMICSVVAAQQGASTQSSAPVPRMVNFTGKAIDAQGKPIAGIAGVTFAIYKEQYEGAPLWLESQNVQADTKGNYTVQLGATKPAGLPLDLFSSGEGAGWRDRERRTRATSGPAAQRALRPESGRRGNHGSAVGIPDTGLGIPGKFSTSDSHPVLRHARDQQR
jgi:hypothetical protein